MSDHISQKMRPTPRIRNIKNIIYNGKTYQINFDSLKKFSDFFYNRRKEYKFVTDILLPEEPIKTTDETFQNFIQFCNGDEYEINDSNVFGLRQLSIHYEVQELKKNIQEYISNNPILVLQNISNQSEGLVEDEQIIASHFFQYIDNSQLSSLSVPVLYRIFNNYDLNINELNEENQKKILDFLFKYLEKQGKQASILFSNIDFEKTQTNIISRLANEYSNIFDFNMLNAESLMKTANELLNETNKTKLEFSSRINEFDKVFNERKEEFNDLKNQISKLTNLVNVQNIKHSNELNNMKNEYEKQIQQMKEQIEVLNRIINEQNLKIKSISQTKTKQPDEIANDSSLIKQEIKEIKNTIKLIEPTIIDKTNKKFITKEQLKNVFEAQKTYQKIQPIIKLEETKQKLQQEIFPIIQEIDQIYKRHIEDQQKNKSKKSLRQMLIEDSHYQELDKQKKSLQNEIDKCENEKSDLYKKLQIDMQPSIIEIFVELDKSLNAAISTINDTL